MRIGEGELDDPRVIALVTHHITAARAETMPGCAHALDPAGLRGPDIRFWAFWEGEELLGVCALKRLTAEHGEVKSMHVAQSARRHGIGGQMVEHVIAAARQAGMRRLSLETGSWDYFRPAHALYRRHGFVECPPFDGYKPDPNSLFMTRMI